MIFNLANTLTLLRIVLIPVLVAVWYLPFSWTYIAATVVFALASITDFFDGWAARSLGQTSSFGEFLDPVADKLMVTTALVLIVAAQPRLSFAIPAIIIIGREITISALREWMAGIGERATVKVAVIGKIKTVVQMVAIGFLLYEQDFIGLPILAIGHIMLIAAAGLTLWSMVVYLRAAWPVIQRENQQDSNK